MNIDTYFKTAPYVKQKEAWEVSKDKEAFALFMEMGTGKTKVIIDTISYLWREGNLTTVVLSAPKGVYLNWVKKELPRHAGFPYEVGVWSSENTVKAERWLHRLADPAHETEGVKIICINTEALSHDKPVLFLNSFMKAHPGCMMVIDESTDIKTVSSNVSRHVAMLGGRAKWRRIMTGTPITQSPLDIFGQFKFLGTRLLGYPTFQAFKNRFADVVQVRMGPRSFPKIMGYRRLDELNKLIAEHSFQVKKAECFDLPPKTFETRFVGWKGEQKRQYDRMANEALIALRNIQGDSIASANLAITKLMKLHQIACGHVKDDDGTIHRFEHNRIKDLLAILEEPLQNPEQKCIVWAAFKEDVRQIKAALQHAYGDKAVVVFDGDTSDVHREEAKERFENDPVCRLFVATASTGGRGLTLLKGTLMVFYSYTDQLEDQLQAQERAHRLGQEFACHIVKMALVASIDEKILASHEHKMSLAKLVLDEGAAILAYGPDESQDTDLLVGR